MSSEHIATQRVPRLEHRSLRFPDHSDHLHEGIDADAET